MLLVLLGASPSAAQLIKGAEDLMRGLTSRGVYRVEVTRPSWTKEMTVEFYDDRNRDASLIVVLKSTARKDEGTVFLKRKAQLWMYIPRAGRTIKMPPSMMLDPWMGTDLTNDDLVRESSISEDYDARILEEKSSNGGTLYTLELTPKPQAPVVWGKVIYTLRMPGYIPVKADYYDERGNLVRTVNFKEVKRMGGRRLPTVMEVIPTGKPGHKTVLRMLEVRFNVSIPPERFDPNQIERWSH